MIEEEVVVHDFGHVSMLPSVSSPTLRQLEEELLDDVEPMHDVFPGEYTVKSLVLSSSYWCMYVE